MIDAPETLHCFLPLVAITVFVGLIVNPPDELTDLSFVLALTVHSVELLTDRHHVWQGPVSFGEMQHVPFNLGKRNVVPLRLHKDSAN
jgi:hypothetical protein